GTRVTEPLPLDGELPLLGTGAAAAGGTVTSTVWVGGVAPTAAAASSRPQPKVVSYPGMPRSVADARKRSPIWSVGTPSLAISAAVPATNGVAIDVPLASM